KTMALPRIGDTSGVVCIHPMGALSALDGCAKPLRVLGRGRWSCAWCPRAPMSSGGMTMPARGTSTLEGDASRAADPGTMRRFRVRLWCVVRQQACACRGERGSVHARQPMSGEPIDGLSDSGFAFLLIAYGTALLALPIQTSAPMAIDGLNLVLHL